MDVGYIYVIYFIKTVNVSAKRSHLAFMFHRLKMNMETLNGHMGLVENYMYNGLQKLLLVSILLFLG